MNENLSKLINETYSITEKVEKTFGKLSAKQLNWKPSEKSWSIGQCLEHLIITNEKDFPAIKNSLKENYKNPFWSKIPFFSSLCGNLLIYLVKPENVRRFKAPKSFQPSQSTISENIVEEFSKHQEKVVSILTETAGLDLEKTKIVSPISDVFTYSLIDCYRVLVLHEERHFRQAERVLKTQGFPQ